MTLPLWLILVPYLLVLGVFLLFTFFNFFHLLRYGFWNFQSALLALAYLFLSAALLLWVYQSLSGVDWYQPLISTESGFSIEFGTANF